MKKPDFKQGWEAFLHWRGWAATAAFCRKGWTATGAFCGKAWRAAAGWSGWKKIFFLPFSLVLLLSAACGAGLLWVFSRRLEAWPPAYFLYALSAYSLTAVCVRLPGAVRGGRQWLDRHPKITAILHNEELHFRLELYFEQLINFAYGGFKIVSGVVLGSAWIGCDGIYNMTQALIQLFQILRRRNAKTLTQQWKAYRFCGVLILLLHLTLTGIVFQMVNWNRAEEHGEIMIITTALFAFYKIINAFISIVRDRKHVRPVDSSVRMLNLAQALFAIFSLQASMFHTFGTGEAWEHGMNLLTGCGVCLLIVSTGIYMICRGNREIKTLLEKNYGE